MKQFQYNVGGTSSRAFGLNDALCRASYAGRERGLMRARFEALLLGETLTDVDGDVWTRIPDSDAPEPVPQSRQDAERLERIALAYLAVIGPVIVTREVEAGPNLTLAQLVVSNARELIAELDKQP